MVLLCCAHQLPGCRTHALLAALAASVVRRGPCRRPQPQAARPATKKRALRRNVAAAPAHVNERKP